MADLDNMVPELGAVLERIRGKQELRPEDADLLEHHLTRDSLVPGVRNRAAWNQHVRHHHNAGVYVHADLNDFGQVNKQQGEDAGDEHIKSFGTVLANAGRAHAARVFRKGGDEFVAWLLRPEDADAFVKEVQGTIPSPLTASIGVGYGRLQAENAMRKAKASKGENPTTQVLSTLDDPPPLGWKPAEENIKDLRRAAIKGAPEADVGGIPGVPEGRVEHRHDGSPNAVLGKSEGGHPVLTGGTPYVMMSGEEPRYPAKKSGHDALRNELLQRGHRFEEIQGFYGKPERSFIVYNLPLHEARDLGKDFGQESVVHSDGAHPVLLYTNGEHADHFSPTKGAKQWPTPPGGDEGWSRVINPMTNTPTYFSLNIDWDTKHPLRKLGPGSHPHNYDWHDEEGVGSPPEVVQPGAAPVTKAEDPNLINQQNAPVGVSTFASTIGPWGKVTPGAQSNLRHYDFRPHAQQIEDLANSHGYQFKYMGPGNIPDLKKDNYNNRTLHIWDPKTAGGDFGEERYTDTWRKAHELAHALTYADLNTKYGEGRRIGKLGIHRTPHEAKRAVEWEWLAAHKQRDIGAQMGHHISDEDFNRELNTVMGDAVHRAIHGTFTEPSSEGFQPHPHAVPLETAHKMIDDHAAMMGLGSHETIKSKALGAPAPVPA